MAIGAVKDAACIIPAGKSKPWETFNYRQTQAHGRESVKVQHQQTDREKDHHLFHITVTSPQLGSVKFSQGQGKIAFQRMSLQNVRSSLPNFYTGNECL